MKRVGFSMIARAAWFVVLNVAVGGCAGTDGVASLLGFNRDTTGQCGSPPPVPPPSLFFAYPGNGATNVSTTIGRLIVSGGGSGTTGLQLSGGGAVIPAGPLAPAPSPLPSPLATPSPPSLGTAPYYAATIPQLAPATTYNVTFNYSQWSSTPPCTQAATLQLGSFTTQ